MTDHEEIILLSKRVTDLEKRIHITNERLNVMVAENATTANCADEMYRKTKKLVSMVQEFLSRFAKVEC